MGLMSYARALMLLSLPMKFTPSELPLRASPNVMSNGSGMGRIRRGLRGKRMTHSPSQVRRSNRRKAKRKAAVS